MKRREFMSLIGGAAAVWPLAARAQQKAIPVVGYLMSRGPNDAAHLAAAFRRGLRDGDFIDGQNVRIEYRWGRGQFDSLKAMAEELCRMPVACSPQPVASRRCWPPRPQRRRSRSFSQ